MSFVHKVISADTVVDGYFDRSLILIPIKSCFHVFKKETKILLYEDNKNGSPNLFLGETFFNMN